MKLLGCNLDLPAFMDRDETDLTEFGVKFGVDIVVVSFTRKREDIEYVRELLARSEMTHGKNNIRVYAKIENLEGISNFSEILQVSDGVVISRNDISTELPPEKVFLAQKWMINQANTAAKPVIMSTQIFESMSDKEIPNRCDTQDVAVAVNDGADALIISDDAAAGKYAIEAVTAISRTCAEAERCIDYKAAL